jgi:uncharacterized protein with von Willebrand factor type A (vWA) domain
VTASAVLGGVDRAAFTVSFASRLRAAGMPVGFTAVEAFTAALGAAPIRTRTELYWVSRTTLVRRHSELETFDAVFGAVFDGAAFDLDPHARRDALPDGAPSDDAWARTPAAAGSEQQGNGLPWVTLPAVTGVDDEIATGRLVPERLPSALEALADTPFDRLDDRQLAAVGAWIEAALPRWPVRRSRRRRVHRGGDRTALRATLHRARRTGFEPIELVRTRPATRRRRVVMLCDVSRSMQPTTTAYLHLMRAAALLTPTEVFAFATRLTRLTAVLSHRSARRAVDLATAAVEDRFGGTRIATNIDALLRGRHGPAVRGATVVIASDGWDTDPPDALDAAMQRLRRRAHAVIWVNPRVAAPGYEPLVGGMAAALPYCDEIVSGHNLRALVDVVSAITRVA